MKRPEALEAVYIYIYIYTCDLVNNIIINKYLEILSRHNLFKTKSVPLCKV